jgi:hypothetical protein
MVNMKILIEIEKNNTKYFIVAIRTDYTIDMVEFLFKDKTLMPLGKLQDYFEVYHYFEFSENLNPTLRRMWYVANEVDEFVNEII